MRPIGSMLSVLLLSCGGGAAPAAVATAPSVQRPAPGPDFEYEVRLDPALSRLDATVCARGPFERLVASWSSAADHLVRAEIRRGGHEPRPLDPEGRVVPIGEVAPGDCVGYVVDLRAAASDARWGRAEGAGAVLLPSTAWLWRPSPRADGATGRLRLVLPEGVSASVPWPRDGDGTYRLGDSAFAFLAHTAFGRFDVDTMRIAGCEVRLARLPGELAVDEAGVREYVRTAAEAVATLYGRMPLPSVQVIVVPVGPGRDPVAFGHVGRGGGASVMLFVRSDAELEAMKRDWIAVHELSHLAVPYIRRSDAWLSEGLATYYQEVLRARAGLRTPLEAWRAIDRGLASGRHGGTGATLDEESARMYRTYAFRRVYWGGTAFALDLDVALRREGSSLDAILEALGRCCLDARRAWSAERLLAEMDRIAGSSLPSEVAARHLSARTIPELAELYDYLGLRRTGDGELALDDDAPGAGIRRAITAE